MTEILISSTVLILAVIVLRALFKNRTSRRLQYALWLVVALRLALPIQFGTSSISIDRIEPEKLETAITQTVREPISGPSYTVIYSQVAEEYATAGQNVQTPEIRHEIEVETAQRITVPTVGEIANAVWLCGAVIMAAWFLFVNLRFRRDLHKNATQITVPGCPIPVKVCPTLTSPCLSGLFRPTVYLTESCADDPQRLRHILAHELTHLRHGDLIWSGLRSILLCVYWFHPLVWVAAILSKRDCELACDEGALAKLGEDQRIAYGKTLLDTVARAPSPNHLLETATSMNETKKQLKERVNFIVKKPKFYLILTICLLLIIAVTIGCTFTGAPDPTTEPTETTEPTIPTTLPAEPAVFDEYLLDQIYLTFTGYHDMRTNWYNAALMATFDSPQELDAYDLFAVGTGDPRDNVLTDEELAYLRGTDFVTYMDQGYLPCRMSREYAENVLDQYFGLTTGDIEMESKYLTYWAETDCYYVISEGHTALDFRLLGAVRQEDKTILFEYYDPYVLAPKCIYETVIRPVEGGYHVLSNRIIEKSNLNPGVKPEVETLPDTVDLIEKLENLFGYRDLVSPHRSNWYNDTLRTRYSSVHELDIHWVFSMAPGIPGCEDLTEAERAYLQSFSGIASSLLVDSPVYRIERAYVEEVLDQYFGVKPGDIEIESRLMVYWEETDCYYIASDFGGITDLQVLRADVLSDGTIRFQYTDTSSNPAYYEAVIQPTPGGYKILSNLQIADPELMQNVNLAPDTRPNPVNLFGTDHLRSSWFNYALKSAYETPADVNLLELFYSSPMGEPLTQEETEFVVAHGLNPEISAIHRYPVSMMDSALQQVFGIGFAECSGVGLDEMVYNPDTDCYYHMHGDLMSGEYQPTDVQQLEDGTVKIYYDGFIYYNDYHGYQTLPMVVTLVPNGDSWRIVSNLPTVELKTYTDTSWCPTAESTTLSYEDFFSKKREFTDSQAIYEKRWRIARNGAMTYVEKATDGYALLHDENGFFIVSFENYDGGDWATGTRKGDWYQYRDDGRALEVIWQVPHTDGIKSVDHYLTDGRYVYYIQYKKFIDQVDLLTGQRYRIFEADRICVESNHCMILYDQSVLIFLTQTKNTVSINRLYLPSGRLDVLYDQIPLEQIHSGSYMHCTDSDTIHWTIMEPNFLNRLWEIVRDPNSSYYSKHADETVLYHELFDGANSIMKSTTWKELSGHTEFIELAQSIEIHEEIPSLLRCSYNTRTGEYSETPYYWDTHMNE